MTEPRRSLAERDPRLARLAEVALRLQAGAVDDAVRKELADSVRGASAYPWEEVVDRVLAQPVDPSDLFNRGLELQRQSILGEGQKAAGPAAPVARPAQAARPVQPVKAGGAPAGGAQAGQVMRRRKAAPRWKVFLAVLIVKGAFYLIGGLLFLWVLALAKERFPDVDIYARYADLKEFVGGWMGR